MKATVKLGGGIWVKSEDKLLLSPPSVTQPTSAKTRTTDHTQTGRVLSTMMQVVMPANVSQPLAVPGGAWLTSCHKKTKGFINRCCDEPVDNSVDKCAAPA